MMLYATYNILPENVANKEGFYNKKGLTVPISSIIRSLVKYPYKSRTYIGGLH
jgi:hypothetical protein